VKPLVVTADDVGLHAAMTDAALRAHDHGVVGAVSVAANGEAFDAAVALLLARPGLDLGAHLVLTGERALSPAREIPSLVGGDGRLLPDFRAFALRAAFGRIDPEHVRTEVARQLERLAERGLRLRHLNAHQHLHAHPLVAPIVLACARRHDIAWIRIPSEAHPGGPSLRGLEMRVLDRLARALRRRLTAGGGRATEATLGIARAGHFAPEVVDDVRRTPAAKTFELVVHPGSDDRELAARYDWGYAWQAELAALCAPELRRRLAAEGLVPARFRDLCDSLAA
jgi:predicted glycoside hydrolase/deacetylase ChbG (UPF0249 family)